GGSFIGYFVALPFYFVAIFISFFPWSFKLPWLTRRLWRKRDLLDNYLLAGIGIVFLIFTLVKTKLPHYTLPAFPLLALLLAKANLRLPRLVTTAWGILLTLAALLVPLLIGPLSQVKRSRTQPKTGCGRRWNSRRSIIRSRVW